MTLNATQTFLWGAVLLFLLFFYLGTTSLRGKKIGGTILAVFMSIFCTLAFTGLGIKKGIDIGGGSSFTVQLKPGVDDKGNEKKITEHSVQQAIGTLEKRLNPNGENDMLIAPQGTDSVLIQMPGVKPEQMEEVENKIKQVARLEFRMVHPQSAAIIERMRTGGAPEFGWLEMPHLEMGKAEPFSGKITEIADDRRSIMVSDTVEGRERVRRFIVSGDTKIVKGAEPAKFDEAKVGMLVNGSFKKDGKYQMLDSIDVSADQKARPVPTLLVGNRADVPGKNVSRAGVSYGQKGYAINIDLDAEGAKLFDELALRHQHEQMAIILDGVVISAPSLEASSYQGHAEITSHSAGGFKYEEAAGLATALQNPLENPLAIIESSNVSAAFGEQTIKQGINTGIVGTALIALFMLIYYRFAGLVALIGVAVNLLMIFGAMALFKITLTMPGIAGIALSVGMGVDANVLIYERLREEMRAGKTLAAGLATAFEKAFAAIFDVHVTTLITSLILFYVASGLVKGFAVTLIVGIFGTLFGALIVTRVMFGWFIDSGKLDKVKFAEFIPQGKYDLLKYAKPFIIGSFGLAALSLLGFAFRPNHGIGIDFRGGAITRFHVVEGTKLDNLAQNAETALKKSGLKTFYVQESTNFSGQHLLSVRSEETDKATVKNAIEAAFPEQLRAGESQTVGSVVGSELAKRSIKAYIIAMLAILIYLSFFYEFSFAVGAIIALFHDCLIVVGLSVLMGQELSIIHIGAVLTVAGYSINDTIIVFDRIREMIKAKGGAGKIRDIMNEAISITLSRTLLTSLTALVPMVALYFFGGPSMKEFSLPIVIGIVVGTYSSIYIASPLVLWYARKTGKSLHRQVLDSVEREAAAKKAATA
jgi:SecD/SecF fusion protein